MALNAGLKLGRLSVRLIPFLYYTPTPCYLQITFAESLPRVFSLFVLVFLKAAKDLHSF